MNQTNKQKNQHTYPGSLLYRNYFNIVSIIKLMYSVNFCHFEMDCELDVAGNNGTSSKTDQEKNTLIMYMH